MADADNTAFRRPNGRPAACDPCRARKVACDHTHPICRRCRKRKQGDSCVYPPTAQRPEASKRWAGSVTASTIERVTETPMEIAPGEAGSHVLGYLHSTESARTKLRDAARKPGFLGGFMSHNTVLEETRNSLSLLKGIDSDDVNVEPELSHQRFSISFHELPRPIRETCLLVLQCLPGQSNEQMIFKQTPPDDWPYTSSGWERMAGELISHSVEEVFRQASDHGERKLEVVAEMLCSNSSKPLHDDHTDSRRWIQQFSGPNLRWESIGILWMQLERVSNILDSLSYSRIAWAKEKESSEMARSCLGYCIDLARRFTTANDLLLDLCRRKATLDSIIDGDAAISSWSSHAVAVSMMTYLGLHVQEGHGAYKPSLCSENKRRLVAQIFTGDKLDVEFTGRPPLISRRYCSIPLPLDIRDEDLVLGEEDLARAVSKLDHKGWNTEGGVYPATVIRARCNSAVIRDELIEIALSHGKQDALHDLHDIKARTLAMESEIPKSLIYQPQDLLGPALDVRTFYLRMVLQLERLQNRFLTERLLLRHGQPDNGDLLITSFSMVSLTVNLWTHKDKFSEKIMKRSFSWLLLVRAAPGGGVLCQELLRPTFSGIHPENPSLSRSSIVQQLSLLVGFLGWVRPDSANGDLCVNCKIIIQRVLDHYLNANANTNTDAQNGGTLESLDWSFLDQPDFNFELLDTFDWIRPEAVHEE